MKVLSVDDSAMIRKIIRGAVEVLDGDLLEASDGIEALELLEEEYRSIDLILLDWNMPRLDGMEVLKKLKADSRFRAIPVMMVTTESERSNIVKAIQHGAVHYLVKPFTIQELVKRIMESLGKGGYKND
ncbi:MAG: response regulator [Caldicoprobacterales bacterium]|jgi:two-component system chemotaxis response regulator CheY|nr:response regulator [Clostridiales bacterium]